MTTSAVIDKLQEFNRAISGVISAPTTMPGALSSDMLPCALAYPAEADHSTPYTSGRRVDRRYLVRLYVWPVGQGEGVDEGYQECLPFLDRFPTKYFNTTVVAPADGTWEQLALEWDSGIRADLTLHGAPGVQTYWGIIYRVRIVVKESIT